MGTFAFASPALYGLFANCIILTDKMIYAKKGLLFTSELSAPVRKIQNLAIDSGVLGKLFGYATVRIDTISGVYTLRNVKNADILYERFYNLGNGYDR